MIQLDLWGKPHPAPRLQAGKIIEHSYTFEGWIFVDTWVIVRYRWMRGTYEIFNEEEGTTMYIGEKRLLKFMGKGN